MMQPRNTSSHAPAYLQGSSIGQLWSWTTRPNGSSDDKECHTKPSSPDDEDRPGRCVMIQEASIGISSDKKSAHGEHHPAEIERSGEHPKEDPRHKRHNEAHAWGLARRIFVASIICWYTFVVYAASAIYIVGIPETRLEFSVGEQEALLGLSLYVLAYGLGPMIWAPLSEMDSIGRSAIYASTFVAFFVFSILAATVESWSGFLVVRFLQAFFGSPCLAIGGASMHDLFPDLTVPYSLAIWIAAAYCGPALGPLIASYLVLEKGWRWGMWEIVWLAAPTLILMVTLPETHGPTIRERRSKTANGSSGTGSATLGAVIAALKDTIVRPVQITLQDPAVAVANLYTAFMYGTYYTFFDAIPRVYPERYNFTVGQLGLSFLSIFAACLVGGVAYCLYIYKESTSDRDDSSKNHEASLRPALVACFLPPIGLFLFGWTSAGDIHWIVSLIGITIYAIGTFVILQCMSVYLPKIYPEYSASLFAANDLCRSLLAAAAIHLGVPLYGNLGIGPGVSVLGGMSVLGIPGMWFIYRKGPALRAMSRFSDE